MIPRIAGILVIMGSAFTGLADHLPDHLQARGQPETTLARINLKDASIGKIIKLYGQPTELKREEQPLPNSSGSIDYYWRRRGLNLHVQTEFAIEHPGWKPVVLLEVGVGTSHKAGKTGDGLKLGDKLSDLRRIYGRRFHLRNIPKLKIHDVMVQWHREEYSLVATLDGHNRITSLTLCAPE
jgi:hypothetical protein